MKNCNNNKYISAAITVLGLVSIAIGLFGFFMAKDASHNASRLYGMFAGAGAGLLTVVVVLTIRGKVISGEKKKIEEIERNDERNIMIGGRVAVVGLYIICGLLIVSCFVFVYMNYVVPALVNMVFIYIGAFGMLIARRYFNKKM